jgi:hypothetical protein
VAICVGTTWAAWQFSLFLVRESGASPSVVTLLWGNVVILAFAFNTSGRAVQLLSMHSNPTAAHGQARLAWLCGGSFAMGIGTEVTHVSSLTHGANGGAMPLWLSGSAWLLEW